MSDPSITIRNNNQTVIINDTETPTVTLAMRPEVSLIIQSPGFSTGPLVTQLTDGRRGEIIVSDKGKIWTVDIIGLQTAA